MKKRTSAFCSFFTAACLTFSSLPVYDANAAEIQPTTKTSLTQADLDAALLDEGLTKNPDRAAVHDPSIVTTTDEEGNTLYYVFGTHMAAAKSYDLTNWEQVYDGYDKNYPLFGVINDEGEVETAPFDTAFENSAFKGTVPTMINGVAADTDFGSYNTTTWHTALDDYNVDGNLWAPDVIYNKAAQKWHMYLSLNGSQSNSVIVLLAADNIEGPYVYQGPVVYSGFSNSIEALSYKNSDLELVYGELDALPDKYAKADKIAWGNYWPHAIDPCVYYDEDGNLRMTYGSWSGGIFDLHLDENTGLRDYSVVYEDDASGQNIRSDKYFGTHLAGGYYVSGEASYMKYIDGRYYLFITNGDLGDTGNYQMRIFSSESPEGPFVDTNGQSAEYDAFKINYNSSYGHIYTGTDNGAPGSTVGARLMTNYKWDFMEYGELSQGHNSVLVNGDDSFVIYHTRFDNGYNNHQLRVHQLYTVGDGALAAAPCEYDALLKDKASYTKEETDGSYDVIWSKYDTNPHWVGGSKANGGSLLYPDTLDCETPEQVELENDGKVTLGSTTIGSWELAKDGKYATITLQDMDDEHLIGTYDCIFIEQNAGGKQTTCFTGVNAKTGISIWGCANEISDARAIALTSQTIEKELPNRTSNNLTLSTTGVSGSVISWESNAPEIIAKDGTITPADEDTQVTLTATIERGSSYFTKKCKVIVTGKNTSLENVTAALPSADYTVELENPFSDKDLDRLYIRYTLSLDETAKADGLGGLFSFYGSKGHVTLHSAPYLSYQNQSGASMEVNKPSAGANEGNDGSKHTYEIIIDRENDCISISKDNTPISLEDNIHSSEGITADDLLDFISENCDTFSWGASTGTEICTLENVIITDSAPITGNFEDSYSVSSSTAAVTLDNPFAGEDISYAKFAYTVNYPNTTVDAYGGLFAFYKSDASSNSLGRISFHAMPYICYNEENGTWIDIKTLTEPGTITGNRTYTYKYIITRDKLRLYVNDEPVLTSVAGSGANYANLLYYLSKCDKLSMGITQNVNSYWASATATISDLNFVINPLSKIYPPYVIIPDKDSENDNTDTDTTDKDNTDTDTTDKDNTNTDKDAIPETPVVPVPDTNTNPSTTEPEDTKKITVKKVTLKSVKNQKGKKMVVKWKKVSNASGYVLEYSTNKKFKKSKTDTVKIKKGTTTSKTIKKLKKGKTYYVRIKAYTKYNGKTYYGKYSNVKKVKIKK